MKSLKEAVFILSHKTLNEFILHHYDFNDDEIVSYYISFLKSLSIRMASNPLELFYNQVTIHQTQSQSNFNKKRTKCLYKRRGFWDFRNTRTSRFCRRRCVFTTSRTRWWGPASGTSSSLFSSGSTRVWTTISLTSHSSSSTSTSLASSKISGRAWTSWLHGPALWKAPRCRTFWTTWWTSSCSLRTCSEWATKTPTAFSLTPCSPTPSSLLSLPPLPAPRKAVWGSILLYICYCRFILTFHIPHSLMWSQFHCLRLRPILDS